MEASVVASPIVQVLFDNVNKLILSEIGTVLGVNNEMTKLSNTLLTIRGVLEDAEGKQFRSQSIQDWVSRLDKTAFQLEDLLDDCSSEAAMHRTGGAFNPKKLYHKWRLGRRLKEAVQELNSLANDRHNFHIVETYVEHDRRRETASLVVEPEYVFGRDQQKEMIVELLVGVASRRLSVLPIVGMGGLGKTTLAQLVRRDDRVVQHFDAVAWVCVTDKYDLKSILKSILEMVSDNKPNSDNLEALQQQLRHELNLKKFFLVLDDVWNDNQDDWANLKTIIDCGSIGSWVVVTTRQPMVAQVMGTLPAHVLKELNEENCWCLIKHRAFGPDTEAPLNLEAIGRRIAKKCVGLPLAAKALGGLLRFKREEEEWTRVEESSIWNLPQEQGSILPVLRLSYQHLPFGLKSCFAYCGLFPKEASILKTDMIFHWMAHGCIPSTGEREPEDVGGDIWKELVLRSFIQECEPVHGMPTAGIIHDLIHDLAESIMENKINVADTVSSSNATGSNNIIRQVEAEPFVPPVRNSMLVAHVSTVANIMHYRRARSVNLSSLESTELPFRKLPSRIHRLKNLRKLDLSCTSVTTFPRKFHRLPTLQILNLNDCADLVSLPKKLRRMTSLRHIFLDNCKSLSHMPRRIGELSSLKSLSMFVVNDVGSQLDELENMNLGGRLEILHLERSDQSHSKANLVQKPNLRDLVLSWDLTDGASSDSSKMKDDEKLLEALEPHLNLVTLGISGFQGGVFAVWLGKMKNLTEMLLDSCKSCTHLPPIGDLPLLKSLRLYNLDLEYIVEEVVNEGVKYPSLEELELQSLANLVGWLKEEGGVEMFPNLQRLKIYGCPLLTLKSTSGGLTSLTKLELSDIEVEGCLSEMVLQQLIVLNELCICNCSGLVVADVQFQHLRLLKSLTLTSIGDLVFLPQAIQHIPSLENLYLNELNQLAALPDWLPNLTGLVISRCPEIPSLPSSIQGMTNLQNLSIRYCPQLERRCQEESGEDWHKIAHIPSFHIA